MHRYRKRVFFTSYLPELPLLLKVAMVMNSTTSAPRRGKSDLMLKPDVVDEAAGGLTGGFLPDLALDADGLLGCLLLMSCSKIRLCSAKVQFGVVADAQALGGAMYG